MPSSLLLRLQRLLRAIGWLAVAGLLLGEIGRWWWLAELFSHFVVFYLALLVPAIFASRGRQLTLAVFSLALISCVARLLPFYLPAAPSVFGRTLSVDTVNLHWQAEDPAPLVAWLQQEAPDVLFVTEYSPAWQAALRPLTRRYAYGCGQVEDSPFGLWLFSRQPLLRCEVRLSANFPYVEAETPFGVRLLGIHPPPPLGGELASARDQQLTDIAQRARGRRSIVLGDLNATIFSPVMRRFLHEAELNDSRQGFGIQTSWRPWRFGPGWLAIDHVLVSSGIAVPSLNRGPVTASDHRPVSAWLTLGGESLDSLPTRIRLPGDGGSTDGETRRPAAPAATTADKPRRPPE